MNTFNNRYKELLYQLRITSAILSRKLGYSSATKLNRLEPQHGENSPSLEVIQDIFRAYPEVNERWLLLGEGNMFKTTVINAKNIQQIGGSDNKFNNLSVVNENNVNYGNEIEKIKIENKHLHEIKQRLEQENERLNSTIQKLFEKM